jgi:hypothetical protein
LMAKGPKGEYRPCDPIRGGMLVMRIAVGELTEEDARRLAESDRAKRKVKKKRLARAKRLRS